MNRAFGRRGTIFAACSSKSSDPLVWLLANFYSLCYRVRVDGVYE